jgi:hypothetical protein
MGKERLRATRLFFVNMLEVDPMNTRGLRAVSMCLLGSALAGCSAGTSDPGGTSGYGTWSDGSTATPMSESGAPTADAGVSTGSGDSGGSMSPGNGMGAVDSGTILSNEASISFDAGVSTDGSGGFAGVFRHPGALVNADQLAFLKAKIAAGAEPWTSALHAAQSSPYGSLTHAATPYANVICGSASASPDGSCNAEKVDAASAYTDALIWALAGDAAHAQKAIEIMNAWSGVLKMHTNSNTPLQCGWVGTEFARAAEIIRHTGANWAQADIDRFAMMLTSAYVPNLINGALPQNGNWELSTADALIQIAVFLDDKADFEQALALWRRRVPAYIYLKSDGPMPVKIPGMGATWYGPPAWVDGFAQETCRDLTHTQWAFGAMINAAETARIQGVDLYTEQATRIVAALELHAGFLNGGAKPAGLCGLGGGVVPMWEIAYNQYVNRAKMALPNTLQLLGKPGFRPTGVDHHLAWETLTHEEVGGVGVQ